VLPASHCRYIAAVRVADFHYDLPPELIAQMPAPQRDQSRLLVLQRPDGRITHRRFPDLLDYLHAGDVVVLNDSRVIPARLRGVKVPSGGEIEVLLAEECGLNDWWVMLRPGKRVRAGTKLTFRDSQGQPTAVTASVIEKNSEGICRLQFDGMPNILDALDALGEVPLPPYITRRPGSEATDDRARYQTVYAQAPGSVAAPTAGLHFTEPLLAGLRQRGVEVCSVTLHVGLGTFAPIKAAQVEKHVMHEERFELTRTTAESINAAKSTGRRVIAVGTTTARVLEHVAAAHDGCLVEGCGRTRLFVYPPYSFRIVDVLLTNFHLPESTLLMLVSAFAAPGELHGRELVLSAYAEAIRERYHFFSYGDAMLIL
jgi:S-adenosylmethionine:tRNA ribosyltransferase-isomerase